MVTTAASPLRNILEGDMRKLLVCAISREGAGRQANRLPLILLEEANFLLTFETMLPRESRTPRTD